MTAVTYRETELIANYPDATAAALVQLKHQAALQPLLVQQAVQGAKDAPLIHVAQLERCHLDQPNPQSADGTTYRTLLTEQVLQGFITPFTQLLHEQPAVELGLVRDLMLTTIAAVILPPEHFTTLRPYTADEQALRQAMTTTAGEVTLVYGLYLLEHFFPGYDFIDITYTAGPTPDWPHFTTTLTGYAYDPQTVTYTRTTH